MRQASTDIPADYPARVRSVRGRLELTQVQLAERIGVSFATVNRWENGQSRPTRLAWQQIVDLESEFGVLQEKAAPAAIAAEAPSMLDFAATPAVVAAVAEANRLAYGHLINPAFATEISLIDPLPHQRIAVYQHMLGLSPLRFLLADDAGAGKTIMTGLYLREVLARRLIKRVLVVPPAGLVGNWEREMRTLFRLPFRIVQGPDARTGNPFVGPDSDLLIISIDTLAGERMFGRMREAITSRIAAPYDLVVFDEAHKLAADREQDFYVRKTDRYRLAEALAGLPADGSRWELGWSATHVLLLTATPHMGKDFPYYCLWRLLAPDALATFDAFQDFPEAQRRRHFIRRTKEEMVRFDGQPLYPQRQCDTLSYELSPAEQQLYAATTSYITETYNKARILNRSAARLAMSVFQRRQASSTYALMRSFERRLERLDEAIELVRSGRAEELERRQRRIGETPDFFETRTADEDADDTGERERHEEFEESALGGLVALTLMELQEERAEVETLLSQARRLADAGEDSKFEKLREVLRDPAFAREKFIIFTEHRDTAEFLVRRLEGLGFTGQVALIHGGLDYRDREAQVELFRRPLDEGGANYLVATDAAGEGINLQFCWLMVNYDVPWNPARLEQRMGRIHRYGQKRDPVIIVNLIAGETREGRVLKTLLDKLELIRKQLRSDKVFDVVGRLFENVSLKAYLEMAATEDGARAAIEGIDGLLTEEQVRALGERERALFGGGDVKSHLPELNAAMEQEQYRRLLPGYIRRFVETAAPLIDLRLEGDPDGIFELIPERTRGLDPVLSAMEFYPVEMQGRLTVYRPRDRADAIWMHPGEPVFDRFCTTLLSRRGDEARRGAIFVDPHAKAPYLFHLAQVSVVHRQPATEAVELFGAHAGRQDNARSEIIESCLIGLRQESDGTIALCPLEHLLLLRGAHGVPPGSVPLARLARGLTGVAAEWIKGDALARMVEEHRARIESTLPERLDWITRGFDHKTAELIAKRQRVSEEARQGDPYAKAELTRVKDQQRQLAAEKERRLKLLKMEPSLIVPGEAEMVAHAIVLPTDDPEERRRHDAEVEAVAMRLARAHEEAAGATVHDVSRPELAWAAGLTDWPGFDLRSLRPATPHGPAEERAIEVKGRAGSGGVEVSENEWAKACNLRDRYWLYVAFDCATPRPRLVKVQDPFGKLLAKAKGSVVIAETEILTAATD
jgi:superfamily II DNA or RNA helicase/transcriptional regulator with XRE-family HTH domain